MDHEHKSDLSPPVFEPPTVSALGVEAEIRELDISDEQAQQLLEALWHIMVTFVDVGWRVDTVQLLLPELFEDAANDNKQEGGVND